MKQGLLKKYAIIFYSSFITIIFGIATPFIGSFIYGFLVLFTHSSLDASKFPPISTIVLTIFVIISMTPFFIKKLDKYLIITLSILYIVSVFYFHFLLLSNVDYYIHDWRL